MNIGESIKRAREKKGITQKELAEIIYVDPAALCRWEKGTRRVSVETLCNIAKALDISYYELVGKKVEE